MPFVSICSQKILNNTHSVKRTMECIVWHKMHSLVSMTYTSLLINTNICPLEVFLFFNLKWNARSARFNGNEYLQIKRPLINYIWCNTLHGGEWNCFGRSFSTSETSGSQRDERVVLFSRAKNKPGFQSILSFKSLIKYTAKV